MGERAGGLTREEVERRYVTGRDDLFRLAWLVVGDAGLAEDLVQEAYARLLVRPEQVREPERVDAYLRSIVLKPLSCLRPKSTSPRWDQSAIGLPAERLGAWRPAAATCRRSR
jgi:hypothetical protein